MGGAVNNFGGAFAPPCPPWRRHWCQPIFCLHHYTTREIAKRSLFLFSLIIFFQSRTNVKVHARGIHNRSGHLDFQHLALTNTPRGQLLNSHTFWFSVIVFFQSRTNLKVLVEPVRTDPGHLGFQNVTKTTAPLGLLTKNPAFLFSQILLLQSRTAI